jgi:sugar phosphate isomerase/epimerase
MTAPIALQLYSLREAAARDYAAVVRQVAEMGYVGVEPAGFPGSTPEVAGKLFKELALQVPSAHTAMPLGNKKNEVLDAMAAIGCKRIVAGKGRDDFKTLELIHKTCDVFNEANAVCMENGLTFGIHNHWWEYLQVEGRYVYRILLERLDPAIQFELDTYWIKTAGVDPAAVLIELGHRAPLLHIKDGPCAKGVPQVAVGEGVMDFPAIVQAGGAATEWMIVELDQCATDMAEAVAQSYRYLVQAGLARGKAA